MTEKFNTEWHDAPDFAEVAEALGVNTVDVMAMMADEIVLFTPDPNDADPMIYKAKLGRDADGILRAGPRSAVGLTSEFHARMKKLVDEAMKNTEWNTDES